MYPTLGESRQAIYDPGTLYTVLRSEQQERLSHSAERELVRSLHAEAARTHARHRARPVHSLRSLVHSLSVPLHHRAVPRHL